MKCSRCGTEFDGDVCPLCGLPVDAKKKARQHQKREKKKEETLSKNISEGKHWSENKSFNKKKYATNSAPGKNATYTTSEKNATYNTPEMKQNSARQNQKFVIGILIGVVVFVILVVILTVALGSRGNKISWDEIVLGEEIPEIESARGDLYDNNEDELDINIKKIEESEYSDYVASCQDMGYTVDAEETSYGFEAYNEEGYSLTIYYYSSLEEMEITLEAPIEVTEITWPTSKLGQAIPTPKSLMGEVAYEGDDAFKMTIAETSEEDFEEYINTVMQAGFTVDRYMYGDSYEAQNSEGYEIEIIYEGNNLMTIRANAYYVEDDEE